MRGHVFLVLLIVSPRYALPHPDDLPPGVLETSRVRVHNRDLLDGLPAYTCLETIAREQKDPKQKKPRPLDVVQVDVGVGREAEIYSWAGEKAFSSLDVGRLIGYGFAGTGLFHTFASNIFAESGAILRLTDEQVFQGRAAIHFTYTYPSLAENWNVDWRGAQGVVGESGDFWVDKATLTLIRLEAVANNFPPNLPLKSMNVAMQYETLSTQNKTVLIPSSAETNATELNETAYRNVTTFSQCHVFEAESSIQDSPEALANAFEKYEALRHAVPAGVEIPIALEGEIRRDTVVIGKVLTARLKAEVKISADLTAPRGAIVHGRIREFRDIQDPPDTCQVSLEFNEIDWPGHVAVFFAEAVNLQQLAGLSTHISRATIQTNNSMAGLLTKSTSESVQPRGIPGVTTFFLTSSHVIPRGFQMTLRTEKTKHL